MTGIYIYKHHIGKRSMSLVKHFFTSLMMSIVIGGMFMFYVGGEMSADYRSYTDQQVLTTSIIVGGSVFVLLFILSIYRPIKNTMRQISYFYVDDYQFMHYYDTDHRTFNKEDIGEIQINMNSIILYDNQFIEMYTAQFEGEPNEMEVALIRYRYPIHKEINHI